MIRNVALLLFKDVAVHVPLTDEELLRRLRDPKLALLNESRVNRMANGFR